MRHSCFQREQTPDNNTIQKMDQQRHLCKHFNAKIGSSFHRLLFDTYQILSLVSGLKDLRYSHLMPLSLNLTITAAW